MYVFVTLLGLGSNARVHIVWSNCAEIGAFSSSICLISRHKNMKFLATNSIAALQATNRNSITLNLLKLRRRLIRSVGYPSKTHQGTYFLQTVSSCLAFRFSYPCWSWLCQIKPYYFGSSK